MTKLLKQCWYTNGCIISVYNCLLHFFFFTVGTVFLQLFYMEALVLFICPLSPWPFCVIATCASPYAASVPYGNGQQMRCRK